MRPEDPRVQRVSWSRGGYTDPAMYRTVIVEAGWRRTERIVPPAGEEHAFDVEHYARRVEIMVSPTGRSVRVYVDGEEIKR